MKQLIPDDIFEATGMSEQEIKTEIAIHLFQLEKLTLSQVCPDYSFSTYYPAGKYLHTME